MRRYGSRLPALAVVAVATFGSPALAEDAADRGARIVEEWCRMCHLHASDRPDPDMAPPFEEIVRWPGRDQTYLTRFLEEDHFPMTIYRLFDHEKADVVAYLMALEAE